MPTTSAGDASRIASVKRVAHEGLERAAGEDAPLGEPVRHRPLDHGSAGVGVVRRRGGSRPTSVGGAVRIGEAAVELRDRADPEVLERLVDGADEADTPTPRHEHDAIAPGEVLDRVRGEHDRRRPVGELAQVDDQLRARGRVEARRRLVEEEHLRFGEQLDGDAGALALAAAQGADPDVAVCGQADGVDRVADRVVDLGCGRRRREPQPRCVAERVSERQVGVDDVVLGHVAEHAAELPQVGVQVDAVEAHRSRGGAATMPAIASSSVVLPAPLGPTIATSSPAATARTTRRRGASARLGCGPGPAGTARRRRCGHPEVRRRQLRLPRRTSPFRVVSRRVPRCRAAIAPSGSFVGRSLAHSTAPR